jgi:hypothetical protein
MCTLAQQPNAPTPDYGVADGKSGFENPPAGFALWLDVWERHLCAVEAPGIADAALDGVDTATRAQVVWQLRLLDQPRAQQQLDDVTSALKTRQQAAGNAAGVAAIKQQIAEVAQLRKSLDGGDQANASLCVTVRQLLDARAAYALPRLSAELGPHEADDDPCVIVADARYRGMENQLYRVEIHQGGPAGTASFKWSRENGSVVFPVTYCAPPTTQPGSSAQMMAVTLARLGHDARLGLAANDWVELVDDRYTLGQRAYPLLQVVAIDAASYSVTLAVPTGITPWPLSSDPLQHPLLRRWDQHKGANVQGVVAVAEGAAASVTLEDGIQVTFAPGGLYATGDYWLISARVAGSGMLYWPATASGAAASLPPRGLHHYAVLGIKGDSGYQVCSCRFDSLCAQMMNTADQRLVNNLVAQPAPPVVKPAKKKTAGAPAKNVGQ